MATTSMTTDKQLGKKLSFADWIARISPEDTLFLSAIGKESIDQITFKWQTDVLDPVAGLRGTAANAVAEGSDAGDFTGVSTEELDNQCQIMRKTIRVSDTANGTANYGRGRELQYQMVKAGASLKRDMEVALLGNGNQATTGGIRTLGGVKALIGETGGTATTHGTVNVKGGTHTGIKADLDTGAVVVSAFEAGAATTAYAPITVAAGKVQAFEDAVLATTNQLYIANSKANIIMAHPSLAPAFSKLQEKFAAGSSSADSSNRVRYFENKKEIDLEVNSIITPLGQKFKIVFNRFVPVATTGEHSVLFFNASDWDQMVFRAPAVTDLAKLGSAESKMIETEFSLRHRHPYASALLNIAAV